MQQVSRDGGHLGPNLGVVELTLALHRVFDSPRDPIVFDTGHQAYVHKMLTGRQTTSTGCASPGGLSGYPSRAESEHDGSRTPTRRRRCPTPTGIAKAYALRGERPHRGGGDRRRRADRRDGVGGAEQHRRRDKDRPLVIVVNDNGRSYAPTIGGLAAPAGHAAAPPAATSACWAGASSALQRGAGASGGRSTTRCTR